MVWVDVMAALILIFSFIGGLKEGAVKSFFALVAMFIAIPLTGFLYGYVVEVFFFIPSETWRNFLGFFGAYIIISVLLAIVFMIPRHLLGNVWDKGVLSPLLGGLFSLIVGGISLVLLRIVVHTFPIFDWLDYILVHSSVISWLTAYLDFIRLMLPEVFWHGSWSSLPLYLALVNPISR
jgi:uncharacterized membrane protein required for colicin V production